MQITTRIADLKRIFLIPGESQPGETLYLLLLAFCYAAYFLLATVMFYSPGGVVEADEFRIFVQGWISVPILTLLALVGVRAFKQRYFQQEDYFYPLMVGISLLASLIGVFCLSLSRRVIMSRTIPPDLSPLAIFVIILFPVIQVVSLAAAYIFRRWLAYQARPEHILLLNRSFPFAMAVFLINFCGVFANVEGYQLSFWVVMESLMIGLVLRVNPLFLKLSNRRRVTLLFDIVAGIVIILSCFDPNFTFDVSHQNFYLGPVNALMHGKTILVDVYSQYGVFVMEFLAAIFNLGHIPLTFPAFSFLIALMTMAQFGMVYFIMRVIFKSVGYAFFGLILCLLLNMFATMGTYQMYPSIGPLRFGLCYLLAAVILLRLKYPRFRLGLVAMEYAILGLASIWSFETFVYVAVIFAVSRVYQTLVDAQNLRSFIGHILMKLAAALAAILLVQAAQALYIFFQSGQWPNWGAYLSFVTKYSTQEFGTELVDPWGSWFYVVMIYSTLIMAVALRWISSHRLDGSLEVQSLVYLAFMGIAQLTYFVGRSHPNNLLHICLPAVVIALYGLQRITHLNEEDFSGFTRASVLVFYSFLAFIAVLHAPVFASKLSNTAYAAVQSLTDDLATFPTPQVFVWHEIELLAAHTSDDDQIREAVQLIQKYAAEQPRVAAFLSPMIATQTVILSKKAQIYPISDPIEDALSSQVVQIILDTPSGLKAGDTIFLMANPKLLNIYQSDTGCTPIACVQVLQQVVNQVCGQFGFDEIETTPKGITAMRLVPYGSGTSDYCSRLAAVSGP